MKIGELSARAGLSVDTIRYYERIGLLPRAGRDGGGRRDYDETILAWIAFLARLRVTGMPIREMVRYAARERRPRARGARCSKRIATGCGPISPNSPPASPRSMRRSRPMPPKRNPKHDMPG